MSIKLSPELLALGVVGVAVGLVLMNRGAAVALGGAAVDAVDNVISGAVMGVGERVGVPLTDADRARELMDAYAAAPWYDQARMAFQISGYASAGDYLAWVFDKSARPAAGAY